MVQTLWRTELKLKVIAIQGGSGISRGIINRRIFFSGNISLEKWYIHFGEQTHGQIFLKLKLKVIAIQGESGISK